MRKPIYLWRYVLKSRGKLNAVSGRSEFSGALIRIGDGFGCLHPWPELGDPGLEDLLEELRSGEVSSGMARSVVQMASVDECWRGRKQSMIDEVRECADKFSSVYVLGVDNMRNVALQKVRGPRLRG